VIDKTVIVTGASSGLGAHIARHLVAEGAQVLAAARRVDRLNDLAGSAAAGPGRLVTLQADVTRAEDAERMASTAVEAFGRLDALVNNAGMEVQGPITELSEADFQKMLQTNVIGPYLCARAALPHLQRQGGSIVNLGSTVVARAPRHRFGYVATKGALEAMSRALAGDLGPYGIRVNVVRPGIVPSELRGFSEAEEERTLGERVPRIQALARVGKGMDVAAAVAFLISDEAAWITGVALDVDGGYALGIS
jgi:NAD(P)-dependent dehydrogenase (short-subunit alcohol dehydrogenase family)